MAYAIKQTEVVFRNAVYGATLGLPPSLKTVHSSLMAQYVTELSKV